MYTSDVHTSDHSFAICDRGNLPIGTGDWSNGLVQPMATGALLYTGIDLGLVSVTLDLTTGHRIPDPGEWDDIVETTIRTDGDLRIESFEHGPVTAFPSVATAGPGTYRLCAHVRGRDVAYDAVANHPDEQYLLVVWPAPAAPDIVHRSTDECGRNLRHAAAHTPPPHPQIPAPPAERARQHQKLLDAARRAKARKTP
ncbi:hypothetical protein [Mangrovihabitans endophyticus]|uniref:Uncharacterized protein n=1 Tax=Mangrovihabitans endophyticus TaxID=1751298 RepID=A0A8J3FKJ7_9ACTN|nr:hypothetical protein [Mangrovihabitans endophyticus]GGK73340.1 hypothetical protein GCM10012284_04010 [Mangrovihabitans endophyticus]